MFSSRDDLQWETNNTLHDVVRIGDITTPWVGEASWHRHPVLLHLRSGRTPEYHHTYWVWQLSANQTFPKVKEGNQ